MNKLDKLLCYLSGNEPWNPYRDKTNWDFIDYLIGYGTPFMAVIAIIFEIIILKIMVGS